MNICLLVGTRPNFMKVAPLCRALARRNVPFRLIHTGQHYDALMSDVFFQQLGLPQPDYFLGVGGGSHTEQTARTMLALEPVLVSEKPDWLVVVGDVNATLAGTLVATKLGIRVAHVEAGLRASDRTMPEELNRLLVDSVADLLLVSEPSGLDNLRREGVSAANIHYVGNVMIDSLAYGRPAAQLLRTAETLGLTPTQYALVTMHRPANVDTAEGLRNVVKAVETLARHYVAVFPMHPRTRARLTEFGLLAALERSANVKLLEPQGYLEFLNLMEHAALLLTDSGGVQEETTYLGVPCLTFRTTTERPVTVDVGTNTLLADLSPATVERYVTDVKNGRYKTGQQPALWDGQAAERVVDVLLRA